VSPEPPHPLAPAVEEADGKMEYYGNRWLVRLSEHEYATPEEWLELHRSGRLPK
jgi:hypothetical protein